jgi:hypothetical protein
MDFVFIVGAERFVFNAPNAGAAMEMCNRQVIDRLNLHPMAWVDRGRNEFIMQQGNFFD